MSKIMFNKTYGMEAAAIEGYKTKTRREEKSLSVLPTNFNPMLTEIVFYPYDLVELHVECRFMGNHVETHHLKPRYKIGEKVAIAQCYKDVINPLDWVNTYIYKDEAGWLNKMFVRKDMMPHHILITNVEVQRLQDITDDDCADEGIRCGPFKDFPNEMFFPYPGCKDSEVCYRPKYAFKILINKVCGRGTWERNPWVYVYSFIKID